MIKRKPFTLMFIALLFATTVGAGTTFAQSNVTVSGVVRSAEDNSPMEWVSVIAETQSVYTSADGSYTIQAAPGTQITFAFVGNVDTTFTVPQGLDKVTHNVELKSESIELEETVTIAYGVRKKGTVAGSVATVKSEAMGSTPTAAFDQALQGQVAGLSVIVNSGEPSAPATMSIRGVNSVNSGTLPLYILDGAAISGSDFNTINPSDIESISVLRDASATSIYGARAANGVIVITTKRGRAGERPHIVYRMQMGFSDMTNRTWNQMNTAERIQYEKEIGLTAGQDYSILGKTDVNWLDVVFNDRAFLQNHELSISGANDKSNYFVSGAYYSNEGIAPGSLFDRFSLRTNYDYKASKKLNIGTSTMLNYQNIQRGDEGAYSTITPITAARFMLPYYDPYRSNGSIASIADGSWAGGGQNPMEWQANNSTKYKKYKLITSVFAEVKPIENLSIKSQFNIDYSHTTAYMQSNPEYAPNLESGRVARNSADGATLSITNTANYRYNPAPGHSFNFMVGQEGVDYRYESFSVSTRGQVTDKIQDLSSGTIATGWSDTVDSNYGFLSFFGRAEYDFKERIYADFSVRADASSRFGKEGRWGTFWSTALMWNIRNEEFMKEYRSWLTIAQVAMSTGTSGNSSIPNYEHLALMAGVDYFGNGGVAPYQIGNEKLGWEQLWSTNLAFHLGFWNRLNVDLELYSKKTTNMLMAVPLPYSLYDGHGWQWQNVGAAVNRGVELSLTGTILKTKSLQWTASANVSYNKDWITELYNGVEQFILEATSTLYTVGESSGSFYMNRFAGVNPANGDALWFDKNGVITNVFDEKNDKVILSKSYFAPWQGGFGTAVRWKGISLSAQFNWVADRWMVNNDRFFEESNGRFKSYNQSRVLLDRWKKPGDITDIPRHDVYTEFDTRLLEDASYLRLKNLSLSYDLPANTIKKSGFISAVRVYGQANNLLTFTKFTGMDPENSMNVYKAAYPMSRQFTFGLDITF